MDFVIFYRPFSQYSVSIVAYLLNSEGCVDPWASFLQDFLHCNLIHFLPVALSFQNPLDFIGLLAQRSKLHISEIFLFEMLMSLLQLFRTDSSVKMFLPFIKCSLKDIPPILVLTMN